MRPEEIRALIHECLVLGAPIVLGPSISYWLGAIMFYCGIGSAVLYLIWRWRAWSLGLHKNEESHETRIDNKGGIYTGRDNTGSRARGGDVTIHGGTFSGGNAGPGGSGGDLSIKGGDAFWDSRSVR
jgi:hypothetical protein